MIYFHGTTRNRLEQILKEGIRPDVPRTWNIEKNDPDRAGCVFITGEQYHACAFALNGIRRLLRSRAPGEPGDRFLDYYFDSKFIIKIVVFHISIPDDVELMRDEKGAESTFRLRGAIPPSWFVGYAEYENRSSDDQRLVITKYTELAAGSEIPEIFQGMGSDGPLHEALKEAR